MKYQSLMSSEMVASSFFLEHSLPFQLLGLNYRDSASIHCGVVEIYLIPVNGTLAISHGNAAS